MKKRLFDFNDDCAHSCQIANDKLLWHRTHITSVPTSASGDFTIHLDNHKAKPQVRVKC